MRVVHRCLLSLAVLAAGSLGSAGASYYLHFTGYLYGTGQDVSVKVDGVPYRSIGLGPVTGWRADQEKPPEALKHYFLQPLYCLDLYHSFTWDDSWWADAVIVPPYPIPPPYNTAEAAWIYQSYGKGELTADQAKGVQLALWEVSHEADWRAAYLQGTQLWATQGDFAILRGASTGSLAYATGILDLLSGEDPASLGAVAVYYRPIGTGSGRQGMLGDHSEIPEPSMLILAGVGLGIFAIRWARRKSCACRTAPRVPVAGRR